MPSCSVINCTNSSTKGFKLCYFPLSDKETCDLWIKNIGRKNWMPTKDSSVCQVHFAPDAWERMRVDGKLKLKYKAVPTLFNNLIQEPSHASASESVEEALHPSTLKEIDVLSNQENDANNEADEEINNSESSDESEEDELSLKNVRKLIKSDQETYDKQSFEKLFKALEKSESLRKIQKKKIKAGKNTIKFLKKQVSISNKCPDFLSNRFNADQLKILSGEHKKVHEWSVETIQKAFSYKFTCGVNGYEQVARELAFPSLRTLSNAFFS